MTCVMVPPCVSPARGAPECPEEGNRLFCGGLQPETRAGQAETGATCVQHRVAPREVREENERRYHDLPNGPLQPAGELRAVVTKRALV